MKLGFTFIYKQGNTEAANNMKLRSVIKLGALFYKFSFPWPALVNTIMKLRVKLKIGTS